MAVSQKDIAKRVGVSQQLVTRALNGHGRVAPETRLRIEEAAKELGYDGRDNNEARMLIARRHGRRARTDVFAVLLPWGQRPGAMLAEPYLMPILAGIEAEADRRGCSLLLSSWGGPGYPLKRPIATSAVDGLILISAKPDWVDVVAETGLPIINLFGLFRPTESVYPDEYSGSRMVTEHLIGLGHRRFAYLGQEAGGLNQRARFEGFRDAMTSSNLPIPPELVELTLANPRRQSGAEGMARILERSSDFTALVCYNDTIAMGAVRVLEAAGLHVPDDVSVVGFDNVSDDYEFTPALTSVSYDRFNFGVVTLTLLSRLADQAHGVVMAAGEPEISNVVPVDLAVRDSTGPVSAHR